LKNSRCWPHWYDIYGQAVIHLELDETLHDEIEDLLWIVYVDGWGEVDALRIFAVRRRECCSRISRLDRRLELQ
jgi:hypothetical protein